MQELKYVCLGLLPVFVQLLRIPPDAVSASCNSVEDYASLDGSDNEREQEYNYAQSQLVDVISMLVYMG